MREFIKKMLELGAELELSGSAIQSTMVINDAEILYSDHMAKLRLIDPEMIKLLKDISSWMSNHDAWWIDSPGRGGFDQARIDNVIKKATE